MPTIGTPTSMRLSIRGSMFAITMVTISSLKYLWVEGHHEVIETWVQLLALTCQCLHIEVYPSALGQPRYNTIQ